MMLKNKIGPALLSAALVLAIGPASAQYSGDTSRDPGQAPIATPPTPSAPQGTVGSGVTPRSSPQAKSPSGSAVKKPDDSDDRKANQSPTLR